jgi:phosphatidylglycerophosphate synthase
MTDTDNRRPLKTRGKAWAEGLAARLAKAYVSPDLISASSVAVAVLGAALLCASGQAGPVPRAILLILAAVCIQLRLLANMLDGMIAVEHDRKSTFGPIWNELPDRIADVLFLVAAGYAAWIDGRDVGAALGWLCAMLAVLTAYVRELGRGLGLPADFSGPMAKPHRMFALTVACLVSAFEPFWGWQGGTFLVALTIIALGCVVTVFRRTKHLAAGLRGKTR